ncbi:hypothetical protein ACWC1D_00765 [Streptomyces sp. NPDC001478]
MALLDRHPRSQYAHVGCEGGGVLEQRQHLAEPGVVVGWHRRPLGVVLGGLPGLMTTGRMGPRTICRRTRPAWSRSWSRGR